MIVRPSEPLENYFGSMTSPLETSCQDLGSYLMGDLLKKVHIVVCKQLGHRTVLLMSDDHPLPESLVLLPNRSSRSMPSNAILPLAPDHEFEPFSPEAE